MKFHSRHLLFVVLLLALQHCSGPYRLKDTQTAQNRIKPDSTRMVDSSIVKMIAPYKQKLEAQMNEVIAITSSDLRKEQPEGTLCTLLAEASVAYANRTGDKPVDMCVMNYGGVRLPVISRGDITLGKVYELMPFDNQLEVLELDGPTCKQLLDLVAAAGGWPVSGVAMTIIDKHAENVMIAGKPFDITKHYTVVTSDYLANGGDNASMLKQAVKRTPLNYKVRDAIVDYLRAHTNSNQPINIQKDGRIIAQP